MKDIRLLNQVFLFLLIISHTQSVQAQEESTFPKQWSWGIKSGFNFAHIHNFLPITDGVVVTAKKRIDIVGTVFLNRRFSPYFSLQAELSYSSKGMNFNNLANKPFIFYRLNYLEVPLMATFSLPLKSSQYYASLGIAPAYALTAKQIFPIVEDPRFIYYDHHPWPEAQRFDCNVLAAVGASFSAFRGSAFLLEIRYTQGFTPIISDTDRILNGAVSYMVGYKF